MRFMVRKVGFATAIACLALSAAAEQRLLPEQSEIIFVSRQMGVPVEGQFRDFSAELDFNPEALADSRVSLSVDLGSVSIGAAEVEQEVVGANWFDTGTHPQATFTSTTIAANGGGGAYTVNGELTLKGTTQPLQVPITLSQSGDSTTASGEFTIERLAFNVGEGEWGDTSLVANDVDVRFELVFSGVPAL